MSLYDRDYMRPHPPSFGEWIRGCTAFRAVFILNVLVFVMQWVFQEAWITDALTGERVRPAGGVSVDELSDGHFWTPFSYMFVHKSWGQFLGNMVLLAFAGRRVQDLYGSKTFVLIYMLAGLVGAGVEMALAAYWMKSTAMVLMGASAPILGLLMAYAIAMPEEILPLVHISLMTMARALIGINVVLGALSLLGWFPQWLPLGDASYFAHLGGAFTGWYFARSLGYGGVPTHLLYQDRIVGSSLRRRPEMARARRQPLRRPHVEVDMEAVRRQNPRNDPRVDLMQDEIDPILDKINDHGMHSLSEDERRALERASRRLAK